MDEKQADAAAEALLQPQRTRSKVDRRPVKRRWPGIVALAGLLGGGAIGYLFFDRLFPSNVIGFLLGAAIDLYRGRKHA